MWLRWGGQAKRYLEPRQNAQLCGINSVGELCAARAVLNLGHGATGPRDIRREPTCRTRSWRERVLASSFGSGVLNPRRSALLAALLRYSLLQAVGSRQTEEELKHMDAGGIGCVYRYVSTLLPAFKSPVSPARIPNCHATKEEIGWVPEGQASHALMHAFPGEHEFRPMDVEAAVVEPIGACSTFSHNELSLMHQIGGRLNQGVQELASCHGTNRGGSSK